MCVSGPKAFLLQKQAPCRAELRRRSRGASSEPGTTASSPPQRDRGLPTTLPKEQSGAWTAVQKLALELELASGSVGPGLPPILIVFRLHAHSLAKLLSLRVLVGNAPKTVIASGAC
ncbi:unnamed protein product [Rangifer tarandus platyrhynchus]|uniref:Uncharacterized protein n=1 Tax=Rangifer tarandus platyrhynchus TaxID=3082113 RepID=A0AC59YSS9_RANTA